jgi:hypothetical protein
MGLVEDSPWVAGRGFHPRLKGIEVGRGSGPGNLAACTLDQLAVIIRARLRQMRYRPGLLDAFVTRTGLIASPRSR